MKHYLVILGLGLFLASQAQAGQKYYYLHLKAVGNPASQKISMQGRFTVSFSNPANIVSYYPVCVNDYGPCLETNQGDKVYLHNGSVVFDYTVYGWKDEVSIQFIPDDLPLTIAIEAQFPDGTRETTTRVVDSVKLGRFAETIHQNTKKTSHVMWLSTEK